MSKYLEALTSISKPILLRLPPEVSHDLAILSLNLMPLQEPDPVSHDLRLETFAFGRFFPNPIGLAAGFDKNAQIVGATRKLGFGFTEIGSVTPFPQPGNPKPRLWRDKEGQSVINHMGMNSAGSNVVHHRLQLGRLNQEKRFIIGVNLGIDAVSSSPEKIYEGYKTFRDVADYVVLNVSCPNVPCPSFRQLENILGYVMDHAKCAGGYYVPVLVKISPDFTLHELDVFTRIAVNREVDGLIVSNTHSTPQGGLSGPLLFELSTKMLAETYIRVEDQFPLIGCGGVDSVERAWQKIEAGATLVQVLTGFIFKGLNITNDITEGLIHRLDQKGYKSISDVIGAKATEWVE